MDAPDPSPSTHEPSRALTMPATLAGRFDRTDIVKAYSQFAADWQIDTSSFKTTSTDAHGRRPTHLQDIHAQAQRLDERAWREVYGYRRLSVNARRYYDALAARFGYYDGVDAPASPDTLAAEIREGMAKAFFATAWASAYDEAFERAEDDAAFLREHGSLSGMDVRDAMPKTIDPAAVAAAERLEAAINRRVTRGGVEALYRARPAGLGPESWGHNAALQAMGHGVGLYDYDDFYRGVGTHVIPDLEFGSEDLSRDYFPAEEG